MSGPAECAGFFPLSPAFFPLVLAFLVAIACWFHCFPGFLPIFFVAFSNRLFCFFSNTFWFVLFKRFFLFFVCFFKSLVFFSLKKKGELACIADNIIIVS